MLEIRLSNYIQVLKKPVRIPLGSIAEVVLFLAVVSSH